MILNVVTIYMYILYKVYAGAMWGDSPSFLDPGMAHWYQEMWKTYGIIRTVIYKYLYKWWVFHIYGDLM